MKNAISNSETLNQCNIKWSNIKTMQQLIVQYHNRTISNSATSNLAITASTAATSAI